MTLLADTVRQLHASERQGMPKAQCAAGQDGMNLAGPGKDVVQNPVSWIVDTVETIEL